MAITQNTYTGNGSTVLYSFTFPYIETTDVKVSLDGSETTEYTLANATTIQFNTAPANGVAIRIYRVTDDAALSAQFYPGSAIRAQDLNDNFTQNLYVTQEVNNNAVRTDGSNTMVGDFDMGGYEVINVGTPTSDGAAVNKQYVDSRLGDLDIPGFTRWTYNAVGGETDLSGAGSTGGTLAYSAGREQVFLNGAQQQRGVDYTADNGTNVEFAVALTAGDVVEVICVNNLNTGTTAQAQDVSFVQSGAGSVTRSVENKLRDFVSVKDFGAVGDGVTDDLAKVKAALESGKVVDGAGLSYAINGTLKPTSFKGLQNATLIQISDNTAANCDTLFLEGLSGFVIRDVTINMGSNVTTLFADDGNNGIKIWGTTSGSGTSQTATYVEDFTLSNVTVTGNGCGTGIHVRHAKRFSVIDCTVRDRISGSSPDPTNDSQNGFQFNDCANFEVMGCTAYNLLTRLSGVNTNKWTRGFLFAEVRDCTITGCNSVLNDQGYDFSGSVSDTSPLYYKGNRQFTVSGCSAASNGTFGFKCANVTHDALFSGCIASNVGNTGFVVSSQLTSIALAENSYRTQNLTYTGCKVVNSLNNGWSGYTSAGFYVDADASGLYPRNVKFVGCSVEDNQAVKTTQNGFVTSVPPINPYTTDHNKDITISAKNCSTYGVVTPYNGIHFPACHLIGDDSGLASNTTWTPVDWAGTEVQDSSGLHNPSSNAENIVIKESGLYLVSASVVFGTTAAGQRKIRIVRNGAATGIESQASAHPTNQTTVSVTGVHYFSTGDTVRIEVWQDSGGSLSYQRDLSYFTLARIA